MLRLKRRARAQLLLLREGSWHLRWILISCTLALAGFAGLSTNVPQWVQITLGLISVALVVIDIRNHRAETRMTKFQPRTTEDFNSVIELLEGNPRCSVYNFRHGTLVLDTLVSEALNTEEFAAKTSKTAYTIPLQIRTMGNRYRRSRVQGNPNAYNEPVLGLASISTTGPAPAMNTIEAYYWDHLATDQLAMVDVTFDDVPQTDLGRLLFVDRHGSLRDFASSWLLNAIGVSVLAITTDGHFVVVMQSSNNDSAQGLYAPTGSGSLEPQDFDGQISLSASQLLANGALREAAEESAIAAEEVGAVFPLGFGRWLQKAAKPEAFFVAFLNIDSHAIKLKRIPNADRAYTSSSQPRRFKQEDPADWQSASPTAMVGEEITNSMSLPLEACLALLARAVERKDPRICSLLGPRFRTNS